MSQAIRARRPTRGGSAADRRPAIGAARAVRTVVGAASAIGAAPVAPARSGPRLDARRPAGRRRSSRGGQVRAQPRPRWPPAGAGPADHGRRLVSRAGAATGWRVGGRARSPAAAVAAALSPSGCRRDRLDAATRVVGHGEPSPRGRRRGPRVGSARRRRRRSERRGRLGCRGGPVVVVVVVSVVASVGGRRATATDVDSDRGAASAVVAATRPPSWSSASSVISLRPFAGVNGADHRGDRRRWRSCPSRLRCRHDG